MNGQVLIWDITEYVSKLQSHISIWDHEIVMEKQTDKLHCQDGFIPVLHWSAESNLKASHKHPIEDLHWLPSNVWVGISVLNLLIKYSQQKSKFPALHVLIKQFFAVYTRECFSKAKSDAIYATIYHVLG